MPPHTHPISSFQDPQARIFPTVLYANDTHLKEMSQGFALKRYLQDFSLSSGILQNSVRTCINSSIVMPSRVACAFAKVSETMKGNRVKTNKIYNFGETQNPASQMYFCINLETTDILFNLSDTTVAFILC